MQGYLSSRKLPWTVISLLMISSLLLAGLAYLTASRSLRNASHVTPSTLAAPGQYIDLGTVNQDTVFNCQKTTPAGCYGPKQIRAAYEIQPVLDAGITGKGRTIVIVDAFQSPTIQHDLQVFDSTFGLNDPTLNIIAPDGLTPFDPTDANQVGWAGEITLDVEWAHAVAPDATLDLVLAKSNNDPDILSATAYAVHHNLGDVISQSFGEGEICVDPALLKQEHALFLEATLKGITLLASTGDQGAAQPTCDGNSYYLSAGSPATDPFVTAVGGTHLVADGTTGAYQSESVWNEPAFEAGGGGGFSTIYRKPFYQIGISAIGKYRGVPDVAYNAAIIGGVLGVWSSSGAGPDHVFRFGGTSAGSPQWAGIVALGDQQARHRLGFLNFAIYLIGHTPSLYAQAFHDVTQGNNSFTGTDANGNPVSVTGYSAAKGWDPATGWGTPRVAGFLHIVAGLPVASTNDVSGM